MSIRDYEHHALIKHGEYRSKETGIRYLYSGKLIEDEDGSFFFFYELEEFGGGIRIPMSDFDDDLDSNFGYEYEYTGVVHDYYGYSIVLFSTLSLHQMNNILYKDYYEEFKSIILPMIKEDIPFPLCREKLVKSILPKLRKRGQNNGTT